MAKSRTIKASLFRLLEQSNQPVYVLNAAREIVFCNQATADWLGEPSEVITTWQCDYHSEVDASLNRAAASLCPPPQVFQGESCETYVSRLATQAAKSPRDNAPTGEATTGDAPASQLPASEANRGLRNEKRHGEAAVDDRSAPESISPQSPTPMAREFRRATCIPLEMPNSSPVVFVFVAAEPSAPQKATQHATQGIDAFHQLLQQIRSEFSLHGGLEPILGRSATSRRLRRQAQRLVPTQDDSRVWDFTIWGPPQTGRQQLAEAIHYTGDRAGPLINVHSHWCDPEQLQTTIREMYSTSREMDCGLPRMLLLEADKLEAAAQIELREFFVLPDFQFSVIATATESLVDMAEQGRFDRELASQLATFEIHLPSLTDRREDIPVMAQAIIERFNSNGNQQIAGLNDAAAQLLTQYHWPGEYQELVAVVEHACRQSSGPNIDKGDLPKRLREAESARQHQREAEEQVDLPQLLADIESELIRRAMEQADGNKTQAAKLLNISRASLLRRLEQSESPKEEELPNSPNTLDSQDENQ